VSGALTDVASAQHEVKLALFRITQELFRDDDQVYVSYGHPGDRRDLKDVLAWTNVRTEQSAATLGTNRSRDEDIFVTAVVSCFRAGVLDDDLVPATAATDILRTIERQVRVTDTTLGGVVRHCFLENTDSAGVSDRQLLSRGRLYQITAEFRALARITS